MVNSDLIEINPNRDVIIISHPRSGSTWLQSCLPHVNCSEPFSRFMTVSYQDDNISCTLQKTPTPYSSAAEFSAMVSDRVLKLSSITKPKSVKIHSILLQNQDIIDWINAQDATVVFLERRDKLKAFKSLLIAYKLHAWFGPITESSVNIDINVAAELYNRVNDPNINLNKKKLTHQSQTVYYEDLMSENKLVSSNPPAQIQNTTDVIIENWDEISAYLSSINLI